MLENQHIVEGIKNVIDKANAVRAEADRRAIKRREMVAEQATAIESLFKSEEKNAHSLEQAKRNLEALAALRSSGFLKDPEKLAALQREIQAARMELGRLQAAASEGRAKSNALARQPEVMGAIQEDAEEEDGWRYAFLRAESKLKQTQAQLKKMATEIVNALERVAEERFKREQERLKVSKELKKDENGLRELFKEVQPERYRLDHEMWEAAFAELNLDRIIQKHGTLGHWIEDLKAKKFAWWKLKDRRAMSLRSHLMTEEFEALAEQYDRNKVRAEQLTEQWYLDGEDMMELAESAYSKYQDLYKRARKKETWKRFFENIEGVRLDGDEGNIYVSARKGSQMSNYRGFLTEYCNRIEDELEKLKQGTRVYQEGIDKISKGQHNPVIDLHEFFQKIEPIVRGRLQQSSKTRQGRRAAA